MLGLFGAYVVIMYCQRVFRVDHQKKLILLPPDICHHHNRQRQRNRQSLSLFPITHMSTTHQWLSLLRELKRSHKEIRWKEGRRKLRDDKTARRRMSRRAPKWAKQYSVNSIVLLRDFNAHTDILGLAWLGGAVSRIEWWFAIGLLLVMDWP